MDEDEEILSGLRSAREWKILEKSGLIGAKSIISQAGWGVPCLAVNVFLLDEDNIVGFEFHVKGMKPYFISKAEVSEIHMSHNSVAMNETLAILVPISRVYCSKSEALARVRAPKVHNSELQESLL